MKIVSYSVPETLEDALREVASSGECARLLAGGTDFAIQLRASIDDGEAALINLKRIPGLRGVRRGGTEIEIGALTTVTEILDDALVADRLPVLREAAGCFASAQIRNAATVGGNLVNASPAADLAIPLLLHDARVRLSGIDRGAVGSRELPLQSFFLGPRRTARCAGEILTSILVPAAAPGFGARFHKAGTRPALDIAVVSVGVGFRIEGGRIAGARVALGAVAPIPFRAAAAERALEGRVPDAETARAAAVAAAGEARPIDDVRASAWYRRHLVRVLVEREVLHVAQG